MQFARAIAGETIKALAVLALVFRSFAHQPVDIASAGAETAYLAAADLSFCGDDSGRDGGAHNPCHACRAGVVDLPSPPCTAKPAYAAFAAFDATPADDTIVRQAVFSTRNPRAPPALA